MPKIDMVGDSEGTPVLVHVKSKIRTCHANPMKCCVEDAVRSVSTRELNH